MKNYFIGGLVVVLIVLGIYISKNKDSDKVESQKAEQKVQQKSPTASWEFTLNDQGDMPKTQVNLSLDDHKFDLGTYTGTCVQMAPDVKDTEAKLAIAFAQCWFAGAGNQLAVFDNGGKITVKMRMIAEEDTQLDAFENMFEINAKNYMKINQ